MPIPRNWSEELVSEWLSLSGYLVESNLPLSTGGAGGRNEADIVGVRIKAVNTERRSLEIHHVEIGSLSNGRIKNIETLNKKFSDNRVKIIKDRYIKLFRADKVVEYKKVYVDTWATNKKVETIKLDKKIRKQQIELWTMAALFQEVFKTIKEEQWEPGYQVKNRKTRTLPECHWMLKLIEALRGAKYISI